MVVALVVLLVLVFGTGVVFMRALKARNITGWFPSYLKQDWRASVPAGTTRHLLFCFVDHYEPGWLKPGYEKECARVARWRSDYPKLCEGHRDSDGRAPVHTFFFPEEEYRPEHIDSLVELCKLGLGEIEIHLHHDNDTDETVRQKFRGFTRLLVDAHGALPVNPATGQPWWAFIHGNWALDNARPDGKWCGVNNELQVLREEGCYADFTLPAAPDPCQTTTINRIYYAIDDPKRPKSHDHGVRVRVGSPAVGDLMLIQGPLGINWRSRKFGIVPRIENSDVRTSCPPTTDRIDAWVNTGIHIENRPEWIFVKVHTHGTQERDMDTLLGGAMNRAFSHMESRYNDGKDWKLHYVSAREMFNIAKAAEAGMEGNPGGYRDYLIPKATYVVQPKTSEVAA